MSCQFNEFFSFKLIIVKKGTYFIKFNMILILGISRYYTNITKSMNFLRFAIQKFVCLLGNQK